MQIQSDIIRGHLESIILKCLVERDMYGYELAKVITEKTDSEYEINAQSLYSAIRRLESNQCLKSYWGDETKGGRRKYYVITDSGKLLFDEQVKNWKFTKYIIDKLLDI